MGKVSALALTLSVALLFNMLGHCEMSLYPGLRRKPLHQTLQQQFDVPSDFLAQLMEENARRRLQEQFQQQLELINMQMNRQRQRQEQRERYQRLQERLEANNDENELDAEAPEQGYASSPIGKVFNINRQNNNNNNPYTNSAYTYPAAANMRLNDPLMRERIPFAVGPSDPRFYQPDEQAESDEDEDTDLDSRALEEYEEYVPAETHNVGDKVAPGAASANAPAAESADKAKDTILAPVETVETSKLVDSGATTFHRIKPQNVAAAAAVGGPNVAAAVKPTALPSSSDAPAEAETAGVGGNGRHDIKALINKLHKEGKSAAILNGEPDGSLVMRQHLGMDGEMGMYIVALIAGVSAAVTVGLIALGIAWYTLHNRSKAAMDVEYPAYGVTGPNKDISPSGDRKLAQSAQMYHYQHQKQQIIAMENRQAVEGSCGMSDVESDDEENEEGDYTVYECPGLAPPTGEMEVRNPLFLDDTPVTPSSNTATASASTDSTTTANNMTQATPQQPQTTKKSTFKVVVGAAPDPKATSTTSTSSEDKKKKYKK